MVSSLCPPDEGPPSPPDISLEEIIFSCDICQATVSEVYATKERHDGFPSGSSGNNSDGIVTKFWIGACSHVFCGKHLNGGGVAFHPKDVAPNAGCPVCPNNLPSSRKQDLYPIRGLSPGEYDDIIPASWLRCPPTRLDAQDAEMDALRFQYQRLASYSRKVNKAWKTADSKRRIMEGTLSSERKQWCKREAETKEALRSKDALIEEQGAKLTKWDGRKDVINHYMSIVALMAKEIADMRAMLVELGYQVPERDYSYQPKAKSKLTSNEEQMQQGHHYESSATLVGSNVRTSSASRKRKANNDAYVDSQEQGLSEVEPKPFDERTLMMPPPLPSRGPPRQPDARDTLPQLKSQQPSYSADNGIQSRHFQADPGKQRPRNPPQRPARYAQQELPQSRSQSSRYAQHSIAGRFEDPMYARGQQTSPALPVNHMDDGTGWQDRSRDAPESYNNHRTDFNPIEHIESPGVHQRLPHRGANPISRHERSSPSTQHGLQPSRMPPSLEMPRQQGHAQLSAQPTYREEGLRHGITPRASIGLDKGHRWSLVMSSRPHQVGLQLEAPSSRQPRRSHVGHNGTTTLSSEFRAQERVSTSRHQEGQTYQLAKPKYLHQVSLPAAMGDTYLEAQPHTVSDISYYETAHGTLEQQSGEDAPRGMEGFYMPPPPLTARPPLGDVGRYRLSTPANGKHSELPATSSVVSPFFGKPSQRQPAESRQETREKFSYAPSLSSQRGRVTGRDRMLPPPSVYTGLGRSMQSRDASDTQLGHVSLRKNNDPSSTSMYSNRSQRVPLATPIRPPQPAPPRGRVSLPTAPSLVQRSVGGDAGMNEVRAVGSQSIFSGAGPTRRSVRR